MNGGDMKRYAIFAILGPPLAAAVLFAVLLPVAGLLEGRWIEISISPQQIPFLLLVATFAALVIGLYDRVTEMMELPSRPVAAAIAGWLLAVIMLREVLALPDIPGWFIAIGLLGGIPALLCSWLTLKLDKRTAADAAGS
jgi:hypothetical protein